MRGDNCSPSGICVIIGSPLRQPADQRYTVSCSRSGRSLEMDRSQDRRQRDHGWDADQVRQLRKHAGLSQRALADELNTRQQTISEWERGAYRPRGTAARLLTRVAEDVQFPFEAPGQPDDRPPATNDSSSPRAASEPTSDRTDDVAGADADEPTPTD